ncbi:alpha/beta hydrolase family protein [Arcticibacter sp.]|jgi:pimeloyl-ACP methyl ester carboxylesterase|uniref:alpha/beta hydrolase family protein n=1 Tax=Arcticibacter sp. TaxID=1872630 RepID=UPI00388FE1B9
MILQKTQIPGSEKKPVFIDYIMADRTDAPLAIFVHGFKGFKDWGTHHLVAQYFADNGCSFLKFNFSHNGMSKEGIDVFDDLEAFAHNTFSKELNDLNEVITYVKSGNDFPPPSKIILVGHSLGGGISILQTNTDARVDKLVTWASISNFRGLWNVDYESYWKKEGVIYMSNSRTNQQMPLYLDVLTDLEENAEKLDLLEAARSLKQPWLIIHGDADTIVTVEQAQLLKRQHPTSYLMVLENADHVFNARHPWLEDFLPEALKQACDSTISFIRQ